MIKIIQEYHPLKKSRHTAEQIAFALRQAISGIPISESCRMMGIKTPTTAITQGTNKIWHLWFRNRYGGHEPPYRFRFDLFDFPNHRS